MCTGIEVIYVRLLNENTYVCRPVEAIKLDDFTFRILPTEDYDPYDEEWEFPPGKIVRCRKELVNNYMSFVAFEEVIR